MAQAGIRSLVQICQEKYAKKDAAAKVWLVANRTRINEQRRAKRHAAKKSNAVTTITRKDTQ